MSVSAISLGAVGAITSRATSTAKTPAASSSAGPAAVTRISKEGDLLSHLSDLQKSDPEQFQGTMEDMADRLRAESMAKGGEEGERLAAAADKIDEAAKTGDLSKLKPPPARRGGPHPGGGGPPGGGGAGAVSSSSSSSSTSAEPADTNGDGTVSPAEQLAYDEKHPEKAEAS